MQLDEYMPFVTVPEGRSGDWEIKRFTLREEDLKMAKLRMLIGHARNYTPPGTYTRLTHNNSIVMSDTYMEKRDHISAYMNATGKVLVSGLGLGMIAQSMLLKRDRGGDRAVEKVTIVELSADVISLVYPHYHAMFGDRIEVINANIFEWKPEKGTRFDYGWHDIWNNICGDNWEEMKKVKRRFCRNITHQECWAEYETKRANR